MPDAEPGSRSIAFSAVWDGVHVRATATAFNDEIRITPVAGKDLEIHRDVWGLHRTRVDDLCAHAQT